MTARIALGAGRSWLIDALIKTIIRTIVAREEQIKQIILEEFNERASDIGG